MSDEMFMFIQEFVSLISLMETHLVPMLNVGTKKIAMYRKIIQIILLEKVRIENYELFWEC